MRNDEREVGGSLGAMPTLVLDTQPPEIEELLERRRAASVDRWDEVWGGVLHMIPRLRSIISGSPAAFIACWGRLLIRRAWN